MNPLHDLDLLQLFIETYSPFYLSREISQQMDLKTSLNIQVDVIEDKRN